MLFNGSYPWLSTVPFSRKLSLSSQRQFSCLWGSCWTAPVYSLAYSDKLPLIPLNILCCNLQNPENHHFLLASLMLKLYFKNCNIFASEQKCCFYSNILFSCLWFFSLNYSWINICFVSQNDRISYICSSFLDLLLDLIIIASACLLLLIFVSQVGQNWIA